MRFHAPDRGGIPPAARAHPALGQVSGRFPALFEGDWPVVAALNPDPLLHHRYSGLPLRFVAQDAALLADGKHYEERILGDGLIATRPANWHDLFNALIWREFPGLKAAVNWRFTRDFPAGTGSRERSRAQMALTHFDEAGVIVHVRSETLLQAWDNHDWPSLFANAEAPWAEHVQLRVFGHALLEHCLAPHQLLVGKALVIAGDIRDDGIIESLADVLAHGRLLEDPLALRPLPLSGIPGWHPGQDKAFYREAPCFRPLRPGRQYPPAWRP